MIRKIDIIRARYRLSELINRKVYQKERISISKKGKNVDVSVPIDGLDIDEEKGLIAAKGVLADLDSEIDEMVDFIYKARLNEKCEKIPGLKLENWIN